MRRILMLSQSTDSEYVDLVAKSFGTNAVIDIITGSEIKGNVIKCPSHDPRSMMSRLVCWIKYFLFVNSWARKNRKTKYDLVFATSNPPVNSFLGLKLKQQFHCPFIFMNWDLYPQVIEKSMKNPLVKAICNIWHRWNAGNFPKIDQMVTIGGVIAESINSKLKKKIDIRIVPISVDTEQLSPIEKKNNSFCKENALTDKFVVLYSGKMGYGHNIEIILEAASKMTEYKEICFIFIGKGPKKRFVEQYITKHPNGNVRLFDYQPNDIFPYSMACGDIGIVSQEASMAHLFMPSKTYSMMACGEAIVGICSEHDDLKELIENNEIGYCVSDSDSDKLVEYIKKLYTNKEFLRQCQKRARAIVEESYSVSVVSEMYKQLFRKFV